MQHPARQDTRPERASNRLSKRFFLITVFSCSLLATFGLLILAGCFPDENYNFHTRSFQLSILLTVLIDVNLLLLITGSKRSDTTAEEKDCNSSRRSFLTWTSSLAQSSAMGTVRQKMNDSIAVVTKKKNPKSRHPIIPAGAEDFQLFKQRCDVCQKCVEVCPNKVLKPSLAYETLMLPELMFNNSYCALDCVKCNEVCPTGALKKISIEDKTDIQIGYAVWIRENCRVIEDKPCNRCEEVCPNASIQMIPSGRFMIPIINTGKCLGCGACQTACPASPLKAIYVEGHRTHRPG